MSLLEADPELGRYIANDEFAAISHAIGSPVVDLERGHFDPREVMSSGRNAFLAIVLSGLIGREMWVESQPALQLLGPGDAFGVSDLQAELVPTEQAWSSLGRSKVALIDDGFLRAVRCRPRLMTGVVERLVERHDYAMVQLAIAQQPRVEDRLRLLFQMFAGRWGRVGPDGIHVDIAATHQALARLIGARRPTVTLALKVLAEDGRITRRSDGSWVVAAGLVGEESPPVFLSDRSRPRPTDREAYDAPLREAS